MNSFREIGGYLELERNRLPLLHEGALALNCGRNALRYLIEQRQIRALLLPSFLCDTVKSVCSDINCRYYSVGPDLLPQFPEPAEGEWLYVVNYYGQLSPAFLAELRQRFSRLIVDNAQAYFESPLPETDTLYTCRKFFGVPDGAFLYTSAPSRPLERDESYEHMRHILGRFERSGREFYAESSENNDRFYSEPVRAMSLLTDNLLRGIDYAFAERQRRENFRTLASLLDEDNLLSVREVPGPFAYPLMLENGMALKKRLAAENIYVPTLWPECLQAFPSGSTERRLAEDILPLPVDQRYSAEDMRYLASEIKKLI